MNLTNNFEDHEVGLGKIHNNYNCKITRTKISKIWTTTTICNMSQTPKTNKAKEANHQIKWILIYKDTILLPMIKLWNGKKKLSNQEQIFPKNGPTNLMQTTLIIHTCGTRSNSRFVLDMILNLIIFI